MAIAIYFHRNVPKQIFLYILDLQTPDIIDFLYLDQSPCYNPTHVEWNVSLAPLPPHVSVQNDGPRDEAQGPGWKKMEKSTDFESSIANLHLQWTFITGTEKGVAWNQIYNRIQLTYILHYNICYNLMILCDFDAFCMAPVTRTTTKTGSFPSWYEMYTNFSPFSFSSRPLPVEIEGSFIPITMYSFIPSFPSKGPTSATASDSCKSTNGKIGLVKLVSLVDLHHFTIKWNYLLACFFIIIRCKPSFLALFAFFMFFQFQKNLLGRFFF